MIPVTVPFELRDPGFDASLHESFTFRTTVGGQPDSDTFRTTEKRRSRILIRLHGSVDSDTFRTTGTGRCQIGSLRAPTYQYAPTYSLPKGLLSVPFERGPGSRVPFGLCPGFDVLICAFFGLRDSGSALWYRLDRTFRSGELAAQDS